MNYSFHRNLSAIGGNKWSFKLNGGKTIQARTLYATDVVVKQPSGKKFHHCLQGGKRSVFAWFRAKDSLTVNAELTVPANAKRVHFNPKRGERFFSIDGQRVDFFSQCWLTAAGECFATV
tara:strand:- start:621 stop:980 length:360 start_codon:yes stop_codon:yes gene_type:complete